MFWGCRSDGANGLYHHGTPRPLVWSAQAPLQGWFPDSRIDRFTHLPS